MFLRTRSRWAPSVLNIGDVPDHRAIQESTHGIVGQLDQFVVVEVWGIVVALEEQRVHGINLRHRRVTRRAHCIALDQLRGDSPLFRREEGPDLIQRFNGGSAIEIGRIAHETGRDRDARQRRDREGEE